MQKKKINKNKPAKKIKKITKGIKKLKPKKSHPHKTKKIKAAPKKIMTKKIMTKKVIVKKAPAKKSKPPKNIKATAHIANKTKKETLNKHKEELKSLITKGKDQGYLTFTEVNDHLPPEIVDTDQIKDIIRLLNED